MGNKFAGGRGGRASPAGARGLRPRLFALLSLGCVAIGCALISCDKPSGGTSKRIVLYTNEGGAEPLSLENDKLRLDYFPDTTEIVLSVKDTGAQWRSIPENAAADPAATVITKSALRSPFTLLYTSFFQQHEGTPRVNKSEVSLTAFADSVELKQYEYALVDGGIEVNYTVGKADRIYYYPIAVPEARMEAYLERLPPENLKEALRVIDSCYRLYDINNLLPTDDKSALLRDYPDLARGQTHILQTIPNFLKAELEGLFNAAGYTMEEYEEDLTRAPVPVEAETPVFNVTLRYELDGGSLLVSVPFDKIGWRKQFALTQLKLLPFFGAGGLEDEGFMLVPDGPGALVYFNNGKQAQNAYNLPVYGWDGGQVRRVKITDAQAAFPAFGIEKNGESILALIEEGASYASIIADVSGRDCSWNSVAPLFTIVHGEEIEFGFGANKDDIVHYENTLPEGERLLVRYTPCAGDGYVGMAKEYRARLLERYPALRNGGTSGGVSGGSSGGKVPVAVEILGAVEKIQQVVGFPVNLPLKLTSSREAEGMIRDFAGWGWENAVIKLNGWFNGGVEHSVPSVLRPVNELGSSQDFGALLAAAREGGMAVFAEADFLYMRKTGRGGGFSLARDALMALNRERMEAYPYNVVGYGQDRWDDPAYLSRPAYMAGLVSSFAAAAKGYSIENIAFRTIGSVLAADYREDDAVSREAAIGVQQKILAERKSSGAKVMVNGGFEYTLPYADFITNMTLEDQKFGIMDAAVPFYQIAIHGLVPYTGTAINLAEDYARYLLRTIETGAGLSFSFMGESSGVLQNTRFQRYFSNEYRRWAAEADGLYRRFVRDFGGLYGQTIENHTVLAPEVTVTEYADGTRVLVNAGKSAFDYEGRIIAGGNYEVIRSEP
ncbi:MAG: DUF5696 domain-containing protein [Treponema sp.]|jgi:hypothetical protein|nr:DUF5696 domain-containing protein [Treponema sp.]